MQFLHFHLWQFPVNEHGTKYNENNKNTVLSKGACLITQNYPPTQFLRQCTRPDDSVRYFKFGDELVSFMMR